MALIQNALLAARSYAEPTSAHASLGKPLRTIIFIIPTAIALGIVYAAAGSVEAMANAGSIGALVLVVLVMGFISSGVRVAAQWERGVVLRLGRFSSVKGPGCCSSSRFSTTCGSSTCGSLALNIPSQKVITKDNVPARSTARCSSWSATPRRP